MFDDKTIMERTTIRPEDKVNVSLCYQDVGAAITSEAIPRDQLKGGVIISWCETVRARLEGREERERLELEEKRTRRKSGRSLPEDSVATGSTATSPVEKDAAPNDADDFVETQHQRAKNELSRLQHLLAETTDAVCTASLEFQKWQLIKSNLGEYDGTILSQEDSKGRESRAADRDQEPASSAGGAREADISSNEGAGEAESEA